MNVQNQSELPAYDVPYNPESDEFPGESIHINEDADWKCTLL